MNYILGVMSAALMLVAIYSLIISRVAFRKRPPLQRAALTAAGAYFIGILLAGPNPSGYSFDWDVIWQYAPGTVIVFTVCLFLFKRSSTGIKL
jgi:hypothetical protein